MGPALYADGPQMVFLGADVRRVSGAGAGAGRAVMLFPAALHAGRRAQLNQAATAEAQAG